MKAKTVKFTNFNFSFRDLFSKLAAGYFFSKGIETNYECILAFLYLIVLVRAEMTKELKEEHAIVIKQLWDVSNHGALAISDDELFENQNAFRLSQSKSSLTRANYNEILFDLVQLNCIEEIDNKWAIIEKVNHEFKEDKIAMLFG